MSGVLLAEPVRLVIWDLDETFWRGTLSEGGVEFIERNAALIVELAHRGIMNSIVSKNNLADIRPLLEERGLWDYFIFPSISWDSKGPRISELVESVGLRPQTVLFIDDNPMNLAEAQHAVPDLQVADPSIIDGMLDNPLFRGKDDRNLTRLAQYKLLERRKADEATSKASRGGSNLEFLRASNICVAVELDVEQHLDRAIELINRTNQLNYTKKRLSEDPEAARDALRGELASRNVQAGLVRVRDRYGDYGFVGFYLLAVHTWRLKYFCFSCRILGMGVERWLYQRLIRPQLTVVGDVLVDLTDSSENVDWVQSMKLGETLTPTPKRSRILLRGGCEMQSLAHYVALEAEEVKGEFPFVRHGRSIPIQHSAFVAARLQGLTPSQGAILNAIGYESQDFESLLASPDQRCDAIILSLWADAIHGVYRHRVTGLIVPFPIDIVNNGVDIRTLDDATLAKAIQDPECRRDFETLKRDYDYLGWPLESSSGIATEFLFTGWLERILAAIPGSTPIFILLGCEEVEDGLGAVSKMWHLITLNDATRAVARSHPNVVLLDPRQAVTKREDIIDAMHFERMVYFRLYEKISNHLATMDAGREQTVVPALPT